MITVARHNLEQDVQFPGFVPAHLLPFWYNSAEVFVFPSVFEGFGLPVLEAMACGTPVITTTESSLPQVVGENGLCLPPHDAIAWTEALRTACHSADWRQRARHDGLVQAGQFTWQRTAGQTIDSYRRALDIS